MAAVVEKMCIRDSSMAIHKIKIFSGRGSEYLAEKIAASFGTVSYTHLVNESGNVPRRGVVPNFSDLEVVALNMASEAVGIDLSLIHI